MSLPIMTVLLSFFDRVVELDRAWTLALNGLHCPAGDAFWLFMSGRNVWFILYAAVAALMIWKLGWKKGLIYVVAAILSIVCTDQLCNLVKDSVCRLRPCCDQDMLASGIRVLEKPGRHIYGFFSAHAANSFGFATITFLALRQVRLTRIPGRAASDLRSISPVQAERTDAALPTDSSVTTEANLTVPEWVAWYGAGVYLWAFLVALSRVFCAKHFIGDILVGAIVGSLVAWGIFSLVRLCVRRF